jgi:hypothetical protein
MKKMFTLSALVLTLSLLLGSCVKNSFNNGFDEGYWLSKERGEVVYSDTYCSYIVIETYFGYNLVRANGNYKPAEGTIIYGDFSSMGTRDLYNRTTGVVFGGTVTDYWLTYNEAQDALDYYCPIGGKGTGVKREFKKSTIRQQQ